MTNQQLKAHCEDVIANPQDHHDWVVDMAKEAFAALTQSASPALKLPDGWVVVPVEPNWEMLSADGCKEHHNGQNCLHHDNRLRIWAAMLAAAPVPHTAPIEPICATGGAEWVKCSERMPENLQDVLVTDGVEVQKCWYDGEFWIGPLVVGGVETHWMPLPAAPIS